MATVLGWLMAADVSAAPRPASTSTASLSSAGQPPASEPPVLDLWTSAGCATGRLGGFTTDPDLGTVLPGEAVLCGPYKDKYRFGVAVFRADAGQSFVFQSQLVPYQPAGASPVRILFPDGLPPHGRGVCLLRSEDVRLACVELIGGPAGATIAQPIPVDHPLVDRPAVFDSEQDTQLPTPGCANCVSLPEDQ
ncbi:hypothetical protein ACN27F_02155 [Solwaraspora sp. WMMB335]|uniref:hypothetical protein n=1 Tax=Solwaraspora sp. WMMB335 TaxID=3404118 RepID=UPI003B95E415